MFYCKIIYFVINTCTLQESSVTVNDKNGEHISREFIVLVIPGNKKDMSV